MPEPTFQFANGRASFKAYVRDGDTLTPPQTLIFREGATSAFLVLKGVHNAEACLAAVDAYQLGVKAGIEEGRDSLRADFANLMGLALAIDIEKLDARQDRLESQQRVA